MNWLMIWLDVNTIAGVYLYHKFGWSGLVDLQQSLIDRLKRGVYGE